jgi:CheY-like chemotaxis protein
MPAVPEWWRHLVGGEAPHAESRHREAVHGGARRRPRSEADPVFVDTRGVPLRYIAVKETFDRLVGRTGWPALAARHAAVVPAEAETVRALFTRYLELGSVRALAEDLEGRGIRTRQRQLKDGRILGGGAFGVGGLAHLLRNRFYIGGVVYRGETFQGLRRTLTANSDQAALARVREHDRCPDLIICDYRLSQGRTGIDVIAQLRGSADPSRPYQRRHSSRASARAAQAAITCSTSRWPRRRCAASSRNCFMGRMPPAGP